MPDEPSTFTRVFAEPVPGYDDHEHQSALQAMLDADETAGHGSEVDEDEAAPPRFEGDTSRMPAEACWTLQHLVGAPFINADHRDAWAALLRFEPLLRSRLSELGLLLVIDRERECAFTRQADDPSSRSRKLLHVKTLGLADSVLLIFCYQRYLATPHEPVVTRAELVDHAMTFRPQRGTDEAKFHKKIASAIDTLTQQRILRRLNDSDRYVVHGVIISLLDTAQLDELLARYRALADGTDPDRETDTDDD